MSVCLKMKMRILNFLYTKTFTFRDVKCIADSPDFIAPEVIEKPPWSSTHLLVHIFLDDSEDAFWLDFHFHLHVHNWRSTRLTAQKGSQATKPPSKDFGPGRVMMTIWVLHYGCYNMEATKCSCNTLHCYFGLDFLTNVFPQGGGPQLLAVGELTW